MEDLHIHLHPAIIHFPVALFITSLVFALLGVFSKKDHFYQTAFQIYLVAVVSVPFAVLTGLSEAREHNLVSHPVFNLHKNFAFLAAGSAYVTLPILWFIKKRLPHLFKKFLIVFLVLIVTAVSIAAYNGGRLVYEYGIGTEEK